MPNDHYSLDDFDFLLPQDLIAQHPKEKRDESRLFVLDRKGPAYIHSAFAFLPDFLRSGDILVFNDAKVISARIPCRKKSGGAVEMLLTSRIDDLRWTAITNRTRRLGLNEVIYSDKDGSIEFRITGKNNEIVEIESNTELTDALLSAIGGLALPPYIKRELNDDDKVRYQTVFASESGAVAAPTAGLHFTNELISAIKAKGIRMVNLTLYVSWGTFQPVRVTDITLHRMHSEKYFLSEESADVINSARGNGERIIAVGTTSVRVLESTFVNGKNVPGRGETDIFIYPPRRITSVDSLITNFHTPRSTLLMLTTAFGGYETIMDAYREAVRLNYRFFSYGDSMLIL
ncbi:MAG: tRNA preQ1(34) S-adenosylmethionine ribosyltransferase-isomerase QueA [Spirochaetes bacterium]|nr:tRNA preQ1(34) S-adenosylmethionine ribosyltransferase-isomerase QueA [Spirochaetota bacterium]